MKLVAFFSQVYYVSFHAHTYHSSCGFRAVIFRVVYFIKVIYDNFAFRPSTFHVDTRTRHWYATTKINSLMWLFSYLPEGIEIRRIQFKD